MNVEETKTTVETQPEEAAAQETEETVEAAAEAPAPADPSWDEEEAEEEEEFETLAPLSDRILNIRPSATLEVNAKAKAMSAEGHDVIYFNAGELDFDTPAHVKEAGIEAINNNETRYTPTAGIPELREAIAEKLERQNALYYGADDVVVTAGAKHAIHTMLQVLCDDGDEVLIPAPYWTSYPEQVRTTGAIPVILPTERRNDWLVDPADIERQINSNTKAIILNSPHNPTGKVYDPEKLGPLVELLSDLDIYVISDEIYERLTFEGTQHVSIAALSPEMIDRTIIVNGLSKSYAMTGWRIGYAAGPPAVLEAARTLLSQSTTCVSSIAQRAAIAALTGDQTDVRNMAFALQERRDILVKGLNETRGFDVEKPDGTFYVFAECGGLIGKSLEGNMIKSSLELSKALLQHAGIATVPGEAFGTPEYIRFSFAIATPKIEEGIQRLQAFVDKLS